MNCPVCGRLEYDCECEPSEPIPEIGGEDDTEDALREHQEEQPPQDLVCPVCGDGGYDRIGMAGHFSDCAEAKQIASEEYLRQREWQAEHLAELQAKKDAGDERLLCAVLFEGKGEPN